MKSTDFENANTGCAAAPDICPHADRCGGCSYQGASYEEQLYHKEYEVRRLLEKAKVEPVRFEPIAGCPEEFRTAYRNKMEYTFGDLVKDGELTLGMHVRRQFLSIVTTDQCRIVPPDFCRVLRATLDFCTERGYRKYDKKRHTGLLRNLVVRRGVRTGELLLNIVTTSEEGFDEEAWTACMRALPLDSEIVGILHTIFDGVADIVACDELRVLYGRDYYMEKLCGLDFRVGAFSFFQTNAEAVERLYLDAVGLIDEVRGKTAFDLYCGTGTITQVLAKHAKKAVGVEIVADSVASARESAVQNGLPNCSFYCGDVFRVLEDEIAEKPDVIVVDPPRAGMSTDAVIKIASYGVPQIVYVSCNPKTLALNLSQFSKLGYRTEYLRPYDNFPFTKHVETVCLLSNTHRPKKESYITLDVEMEDYYRIKNEGKNSNTGK